MDSHMIDPGLINAACKKAMGSPPAWGRDDCCTFACDIIKAQFGLDLMAPLRGKYGNQKEAQEVMWRYASGNLGQVAIKLARRAAIEPVAFPFVGAHVGVVSGTAGPTLAVSDGAAWVMRAQEMVLRVPLWRAVLAWRVR